MRNVQKAYFLTVLVLLFGCDLSSDTSGITVFSYSFDFGDNPDYWQADFTDFRPGLDSSSYELKFAYTDRPANLGNRKSMMMSGNNHSDDLFMFMKRKNNGPVPQYRLYTGF
jgi:hypothetical protein